VVVLFLMLPLFVMMLIVLVDDFADLSVEH
jgi:hypothetical protein